MQALLKRSVLLFILIFLFSVIYYFRLYDYFTFESLKLHRELLFSWKKEHFLLMLFGFMGVYILAVACSIPGATLLTLTAGFLFGSLLGTVLVVISATIGAFILFIAVEVALYNWVRERFSKRIQLMEKGFQKNAFSYLLFLRLVPLFPFWLVNIVAALLGTPKRTFLITTFFGIIPGSFIFVLVGNSLGYIIDSNQPPNLGIIFDPRVLIPLLALAVLSLLPIAYKYYKGKNNHG